jgi:hypothetical protein
MKVLRPAYESGQRRNKRGNHMTREIANQPDMTKSLVFDEFGRYEIAEIVDDGELDQVGGGANWICPDLSGNIYCPTTTAPPSAPQAGADGDGG